ncbi:MAG: hypothetical protein NVS4B12_20880 [Ktedonobacteraceae bacterium]
MRELEAPEIGGVQSIPGAALAEWPVAVAGINQRDYGDLHTYV